jgi:signal peptidase II
MTMVTLVTAVATIVIDQLAKSAVRSTLATCTQPPVSECDQVQLIGPALSILRLENAGSGLGFSDGLWLWPALTILGVGIAVALARWSKRSVTMAVAVGFLVSGALGNLVDRLIFGSVTDYLSIAWGPVAGIGINGADLALLCGAVIATGSLYRSLFGSSASPATAAIA